MALKNYGHIYFDSDKQKWVIDEAEPHICIRLKHVFPKLFKGGIVPFIFDDTIEIAADLLWFMLRYPLSITKSDHKRLTQGNEDYIREVNRMESILRPTHVLHEILLNEGEKARDYQLRGKDYYIAGKRLLLGDDIGLGKTLTAILSFLEQGMIPAWVTVQSHLTIQWKAEIERFTNLSVHIIKQKKPYDLPPADVYIIKYGLLSGWVDVFNNTLCKSAIFDEIQELRHSTTDKYSGAKALAACAEYCMGLSATPIYNYGNEIYNVLNIIKNGCLGDSYEFMREWCSGNGKIVNNPQALGTYLRELRVFLRRTRAEVGRELPVINKLIYPVEYDEDAVAEEEEIAKQLAIKVMNGTFMERGAASRELDMRVRQATGIAKARQVAAWVKIFLENSEPIVLVGWHRDVYDIWLNELAEYNPLLYTGTESPVQKEKTKQAFINGETNLMILSLRSGIGLDGLQRRCKTIVFGELDWSPKVHEQVIGRIDRDGQENQVTAIFLITDWGSDPVIVDLLGLKASQSAGIVDPLLATSEQYSDESRIKVLAQTFLNKKHNNSHTVTQN